MMRSSAMKHLRQNILFRCLLIGIACSLLLGISLWIFPYVVSLYHQIQGGQKLSQAINLEELNGMTCVHSMTLDAEQNSLLQRSNSDFEAAIRYDNHMAQAELLRGRTLCLLDKPHKAIRAFQAYINLRPKNPIGHLELGFVYERLGQKDQATFEWNAAGVSWQDFYRSGEQLVIEKKYTQAIPWFQRASWLAPEAGDPYYAAGIVYQSQDNWEQAIKSYQSALAAKTFQDISLGDIYLRLGMMYQTDSGFQDLDIALEMYHNVMLPEAKSSDQIQAEAHYKIAEIYIWRGRDVLLVIDELKEALILNPLHYWSHMRLGRALFTAYHEIDRAREEIDLAIELWPDNTSKKWPYRILGDIYKEAGMAENAIDAYQKALLFDPEDSDLKAKLVVIQNQYPH